MAKKEFKKAHLIKMNVRGKEGSLFNNSGFNYGIDAKTNSANKLLENAEKWLKNGLFFKAVTYTVDEDNDNCIHQCYKMIMRDDIVSIEIIVDQMIKKEMLFDEILCWEMKD